MRNLEFHRDDRRLWIGVLDGFLKKPTLSVIEAGNFRKLAVFDSEEAALETQELLTYFLCGQSADKAQKGE